MSDFSFPTPPAPMSAPEPPSSAGAEHPAGPPPWWGELEAARAREREVLERLLSQQLREQRSARRQRGLFYAFIAVYLGLLMWLSHGVDLQEMEMASLPGSRHVAVVELVGAILPDGDHDAKGVMESLRAAFEDRQTAGVVLRINSPGGSPVQAGMIYDEVRRLRQAHPDIPLYAALEDLCASGGYYVAVAAQDIYADKATLVGSIGVIMRSFGLQEAIAKLGVENRVLTAGRDKNFLDPFSPLEESQRQQAQTILDQVHQQFIDVVRQGRGKRLKGGEEELFTGRVWTGEEAVRLGLVDGLGTVESIARQRIGVTKLKTFSSETTWIDKLSKQLGKTSLSARLLL